MGKMEVMPFLRGEVFTQYTDDQNQDATGGAQFEGMEFWCEDKDYSGATNGGVVPDRTNSQVKVRVVRNSSGGTLQGRRFCKNRLSGTDPKTNHGQIGGYATSIADVVMGIIDDHLPATGVPNGALFYVVIEGPAKVTTAGAGDTNIAAGDAVIPSTNGTAIGGVEAAAGNAQADVTAAIQLAMNLRATALVAVNAISTDFVVMLKPARM